MEYHEAANFLFDLRRYPSRTGVEPTRQLLEYLGDPGEDLRVVQVAGSNGKGSTARMLESVLREAGYDVGLFTSPHLDDLRERVLVNGRRVSKRAVCEFAETVEAYVAEETVQGSDTEIGEGSDAETGKGAGVHTDEGSAETGDGSDAEESPERLPPTFFEATTAMAAWTFARADVDVAVLEVGIGGRYDATSAFDPEAAAVTNVGLEHTDVLGETVEEIARDKAAVAPSPSTGTAASPNPLVTAAEGDALSAVEAVAGEVLRVGTGDDAHVRVSSGAREGVEQAVTVAGDDWSVETYLPLLGDHQARNAGVAAALARQLGGVGTDDLERGLRNAHWPGRFEVMDREPLVVLDGAHNPGSCEAVASTLETFDFDDLHLVFGAMADKDHRGMVSALPAADRVYTCRPDYGRAETAETLAAVFEADSRAGVVGAHGPVAEAVEAALDAAGPTDAVLVCGSLFVVAEARRRWTRSYVPKRVPDLGTAASVLERADVTAGGVYRMRGKGVHRVVGTRVRPQQAAYLKQELLSLGGECAVSGVRVRERELVDVVLMGTLAQFKRLAETLDGQSEGLPVVADELRVALDIQQPSQEGSAPAPREGNDRPTRAESDRSSRAGSDGQRAYPWEDGTAVVGILNVTPDSFYDGGRYEGLEDAVDRARAMVEAGADVVDVGGESTRPGADPVPVDEELDRVVPVVERVADLDALVAVDTRKAEVARAALDAGADVLNDVSGLEDPEMRLVAAEHDVPVVVMHSIETPVDPDAEVEYDDVVADTIDALTEQVLLAEKAGLDRSQIIVDPGLGFGKSATESFELLGRVGEFRALGCPVMVGHSRKSMFSKVGADDTEGRLAATVAATALAADRGADLVRVHDVAENLAAVKTAAMAADTRSVTDDG